MSRRHELRLGATTVEPVERAALCVVGAERHQPCALEVDRVGEHEVGRGIDVAGGDDSVDEVFGGLLHPLVDHLHSCLGLHVSKIF